MKVTLGICLFLAVASSVFAGPRDVVYVTDTETKDSNPAVAGDSRIDTFRQKDELLKLYSRSTAARILREKLTPVCGGMGFKMSSTTLKEYTNLCEGERFGDEPSIATCTGFLIGEDLLATAGHCMTGPATCASSAWVFDYRTDAIGSFKDPHVLATSVFYCKEIVKSVQPSAFSSEDWAVIRLDRKVTNRKPLPLRAAGKIEDDAKLSMIGYPVGLPLKIATEAKVVGNSADVYFNATLASFGGNSGSPVINQKTGLVEGILVRGERDFTRDEENDCLRVNVCEEQNCKGEGVTRIAPVNLLLWTLSWSTPPISN